MQAADIIALVILLIVWGAQFTLRPLLSRNIKTVLTTAILGTAIPLVVNSYTLYFLWINSPPPIRYFLPPYISINYYLFTIGRRFWIAYIISLVIALVFLILIHSISKERRDKIFELEEPYLITLCIALLAHPLWASYILLTLLIYLLASISSKGRRISLYYLWLPIAMIILALEPLLSKVEIFRLLQISS